MTGREPGTEALATAFEEQLQRLVAVAIGTIKTIGAGTTRFRRSEWASCLANWCSWVCSPSWRGGVSPRAVRLR